MLYNNSFDTNLYEFPSILSTDLPNELKPAMETPPIIKELEVIPPDPKPDITPNFDNMMINNFYAAINSIDSMNEKDRYNFIRDYIDTITTQILDGTCRYIKKLVTPEFLSTCKDVISNIPITASRRIALNYLAYSYFFSTNPNPDVISLIMEIGYIINRDYVNILMDLGNGLSRQDATNICISRFSSTDEKLNVHRMNYSIYKISPKIMTQQMIIWIFEALFNQVRYLFVATMFEDSSILFIQKNSQYVFYEDTFSNLSLALLTMVNNMMLNDINYLLKLFLDEWEYHGRQEVRFSLRSLSSDFSRIRSVVEAMESSDVLIP